MSRLVFFLSKLRYIIDIDTRKLFFNAHIRPHIDYASVVWDGCSDVLKNKQTNSLLRRDVKLIFPYTTLTRNWKRRELWAYKDNLNITRVCSCTGSLTMYSHTPSRYSNSRSKKLSLPRPRIDIFKTIISFSGAFLWNNLPLTVRSCQSLSSVKRKLRAHLEAVT